MAVESASLKILFYQNEIKLKQPLLLINEMVGFCFSNQKNKSQPFQTKQCK